MGISGAIPNHKFKDVKETPEVLVVKKKLKEVAAYLCVARSLCVDVYTYLNEPTFKLGLPGFNTYGEQPFELDVQTTIVINGETHVTAKKKTIRHYTLESAYAKLIYDTTGSVPMPEKLEVERTPEVEQYLTQLQAAVQAGLDHGRFRKDLANEFMPLFGIEIPVKKHFFFRIPVTPPEQVFLDYEADAFTEEEALKLVTKRIEHDNARQARGSYRDYATVANAMSPGYWPVPEGAVVTLNPEKKPKVLN